jgi:rRNA-processing protein FCF1
LIILDSNALIYSIKGKIDLRKFISDEIAVPSSVVQELNKLSSKNRDAKMALVILKNFKILEVDGSGDEGIIEAALKYKGDVLTNDRELGRRLREKNVRVTTVAGTSVRRL